MSTKSKGVLSSLTPSELNIAKQSKKKALKTESELTCCAWAWLTFQKLKLPLSSDSML